MTYGKTYSYQLKFDADTTNVRQQLQNVLNEVSSLARNNNLQLFNTDSVKTAQTELMKLGQIIQSSFNVDTNKLDLTKFQRQLQSSGLSVEQLRNHFQMLGPDGAQAFQNIASAISKAEAPAFKLNGILDNLWVTMKNTMRWQLTSSMLHGFIGTIQTAWGYTQDLNESLNSIRIVTGNSTEEMAVFAQEANKAAQALNTTTVDYTDASLIYYQQGLDTEEVKERTKITIDAANAAGTSAEQMSEYLTSVWNSYQVATDQLESYVDKMAAVGASTATSLEEISTAMVNVASTANTVGVNMDQLTAIISTVASTTRQSASSIGTAFKTIFARIGDLTLGETLEDGLDLGSVSSQLDKVGISVLDVSGDLREMGEVVEEIGEKWQTWTAAQQTAIAQVLAGKRQYTQLIALFDNWDAYQNALNISETSEGTLARQAETFAESWEAARKNVKAAAEGVYDSLIDDEFWIGVDKTLAKTLNLVEEFIDSIGGLNGVVSGLGFAFLNTFGDKVAASLRDVNNSMLELTGQQEKRNADMRLEFAQQAEILGVSEKEVDIMYQRLALMREYEDVRSKMSKNQQNEVEMEIQLHNFILERNQALNESTKELEKQTDLYKQLVQAAGDVNFDAEYRAAIQSHNIDQTNRDEVRAALALQLEQQHGITGKDADITAEQQLAKLEAESLATLKQKYIVLGTIRQVQEQVNNAHKIGNQEEREGTKITQEQKQAIEQVLRLFDKTQIKDNTGKIIAESMTEAGKAAGGFRQEIADLQKVLATTDDWEVILNKLKEFETRAINNAQQAKNSIPLYSQLRSATGNYAEETKNAIQSGEKLGDALVRQTIAADSASQNFERLTLELQQIKTGTTDWATTLVSVGQAISGLSMGLNSLSNVYNTVDEAVKNGTFTFADFRSIMMSVGMVIPVVAKYSGMLRDAIMMNALATDAETGAVTVNAGAKGIAALITKGLGNAELSAAAKASVFAAAQAAAFGIITVGIVAIMGLVALLDKLIVTQEEASEAIQDSIDKYEQEKQKVDELTNSIESLTSSIEELNEKDSLTVVEQEELDRLNEELMLLQQQKRIQEDIAKGARIQAAKEIVNKGATANSFTSQLSTGHAIATGRVVDLGYGKKGPEYEYLTAKQYREKYLADSLELSDEEYSARYQKYEQFLQQEQDALNKYLDENAENIQNAETSFRTFIEAVNSGDFDATPEQIAEQLESIKAVRMSIYGNDKTRYQEAVIKPTLDFAAIEEVSDKLYHALAEGGEGAADGTAFITKEIEQLLNTAGISVDDFLSYLDERIENTKNRVIESIDGAEDHINELSGEDWDILAELNLDGIEDWDDLVQSLEDYKSNEVDVDVNVDDGGLSTLLEFLDKANTMEDPLEKALQNYAKQGYLTMDQVQDLIKENQGYAEYITKTAEGEYGLNNLIYRDFLEIENAERQALDETIALMQERNGINRDYLDNYISSYRQIQEMIDADLADGGELKYSYIDEADAERIKSLAGYLAANSEAFMNGEKDIVAYFNTLSRGVDRIAYGFEKLDAEIEGTSEKTDDMEAMFTSMAGEIASGLNEVNRLWKSGKITMQDYYDATLAGAQAAVKLLSKQYSNEIKLVNGAWVAKDGAIQDVTSDLGEEEAAAIRAHNAEIEGAMDAANGYQEMINRAETFIPLVDAVTQNFEYLKNYADAFGQIDFTIHNNFDQTSQEFQTMCEQIGSEMENLIQNDESMYKQLVSNLRAAGVEFSEDVLKSEGTLTNLMKNDTVAAATVIDTATGAAGATIADVTTAAGEVITTLGNLIKEFDYELSFTPFVKSWGKLQIEKWLAGEANLPFELPTLGLQITGSGTNASAFGSALAAAGETLKSFASNPNGGGLADVVPVGRNQGGLWGFGDPDDYWDTAYDLLDPSSIKTDNYRPDEKETSSGKETSAKEPKTEEGSELDYKELEEHYHEINKLIEEYQRHLKEIQTQIDRTYGAGKLKEYNKEQAKLNQLIEAQQKKMQLVQDHINGNAAYGMEGYLAKVRSLGLEPEFSDEGRILNYTKLLRQATEEYNKFVDEWNSHQNEVLIPDAEGNYPESWQDQHEKEKEAVEKYYEDRVQALKDLEESIELYWEEFEKYEQYMRDLEDNKLKKIAYVLEFQIDYKNAKKDVRNLAKMIEEAIGDALDHGLKAAIINFENMQDELNMKSLYDDNFAQLVQKVEESKYNKYIDQEELANQLANLREEVIGSAEALIEWAESIEDIVPDAIDAARERFEIFTDQLDHNTSIIDTIKEIMVLQGLTLKTAQGYNDIRDMYTKRMEATLAKAKLNRQWYDNALSELTIAQAALDAATQGTEEYDILKANRDALLEEFNASQEAMLESAKETMETAREMYIDSVERTAYELEQVLTRGDGFDLLQDKYDHYIDTEERYLDTVNKIYETTKLNNKIQEQIDKSTNAAHTKRLQELQEEFQLRAKNNELSEYDIEIMNAKLQVLMKQMELEDAASNRSTLRMVRNSRGNYDYQFTANPDDLNDINQEYLDAAQEWYNIAKNKVKEVTGEIIDTWQEMTDKIKEIYEDETLTVDEREARIAEIREYYTQKVKDLESEKQKAIVDMTEAGNLAIETFRENNKTVIDAMGGDVDNLRDIFSDDLAAILGGADDFNNQFAEDMDNLSKEVEKFDELFDDTIDKMNEHVNEFNENVQEVNNEVGVSYEDLKYILDQVSDSTEQLTWRGEEAVSNMWDQISAAQQASMEYASMADSILAAARAYQELAIAINEVQFNRLGSAADVSYDNSEFFPSDQDLYNLLGGANIDYSALMSQALASGQLQYGSDAYQQLMNFRDIAYSDRGGADKGWLNNNELDQIFKDYTSGSLSGSNLEWFTGASGNYSGSYDNNLGDFEYWLRMHGIAGYATGGYTGDFDDGKLAILHEKELVLNSEDTKNILDAVDLVRGENSIWTNIAKTLDASISFMMTLLSGKFSPSITVERDKDILEQRVDIQATFPNVTDSSEIEEALSNIVNNAAQFASQRN